MKKRIGSLLLILALCFTLLPSAAFVAETMDTWDGTADTSWYDENETEFHLKTAEQLAGIVSASVILPLQLRVTMTASTMQNKKAG